MTSSLLLDDVEVLEVSRMVVLRISTAKAFNSAVKKISDAPNCLLHLFTKHLYDNFPLRTNSWPV